MASSTNHTKRQGPPPGMNKLPDPPHEEGTMHALVAPAVVLTLGAMLLVPAPGVATGFWPWAPTSLVLFAGLFVLVTLHSGKVLQHLKRMRQNRDETLEAQRTELETARRLYRRLMGIHGSCLTMATKSTPKSLYNRITQICFDTFDCERASLLTVDPETKELVVRSAVGYGDIDLVLEARQPVGDGIAGWVAEHRKPLILGPKVDTKKFWKFVPQVEPIHSAMAAPITMHDRMLGVLCISSKSENTSYNQEDLRALQVLAWNAGIHIRHLVGDPVEIADRATRKIA